MKLSSAFLCEDLFLISTKIKTQSTWPHQGTCFHLAQCNFTKHPSCNFTWPASSPNSRVVHIFPRKFQIVISLRVLGPEGLVHLRSTPAWTKRISWVNHKSNKLTPSLELRGKNKRQRRIETQQQSPSPRGLNRRSRTICPSKWADKCRHVANLARIASCLVDSRTKRKVLPLKVSSPCHHRQRRRRNPHPGPTV